MPKVSVITPAYRAEGFIERCVRSVIAQTYDDWEMLVVSDDMQDYSALLAAHGIRDPRLRFVSTGRVASGLSNARNVGLDAASAKIIALLDADDRFYSTKLEKMVPSTEAYGFCCSAFDYVRYDETQRTVIRSVGASAQTGPLTPQRYCDIYYSGNAICVFDKEQFPLRWREDFPLAEDIVFVMNAFAHRNTLYHLNDPLHEYIYTENSLTTAKEAPAGFIAAKKRMLGMLDSGEITFSVPDSAGVFHRFISLSMEAEQQYARAVGQGSTITFSEIFEKLLGLH